MAHVPKYKQLEQRLLAELESGRYPAGSRIPTREELVTRFGVTRTTVNQALRELVASGILSTGRRGGTVYTGKRPPLKVLVLAQSAAPRWFGVREAAHMDILSPLLYHAADFQLEFADLKNFEPTAEKFAEIDCAVVIMPGEETMRRLRPFAAKVLIVNRCAEGFHYISTPHRETVAELVGRNLERAGARVSAVCLDPKGDQGPVIAERKAGFFDACTKCGVTPVFAEVESDFQEVRAALDRIERQPGEALVLCSPMRGLTGAVLNWAHAHGLSFQRDFFYSDFDNPYSLANPEEVVCSAIQDYTMMGRELYDALRTWGQAMPVRRQVPVRMVP